MHASKIISGLALPLALAVTAATGPAMGRLRWQPWPTGSRRAAIAATASVMAWGDNSAAETRQWHAGSQHAARRGPRTSSVAVVAAPAQAAPTPVLSLRQAEAIVNLQAPATSALCAVCRPPDPTTCVGDRSHVDAKALNHALAS